MLADCKIELFGSLRFYLGPEKAITRFRSQKTAALLAYLAFHRDRLHAREHLVDLLWGESDLNDGRANLSTSLSSLRKQLEPPGVQRGSILIADPARIGLNPKIETDVATFNALLTSARRAGGDPQRAALLRERALKLFQPTFVSGIYEPWIDKTQSELNETASVALCQLADYYLNVGNPDAARDLVRQVYAIGSPGPSLTSRLQSLIDGEYIVARTPQSSGTAHFRSASAVAEYKPNSTPQSKPSKTESRSVPSPVAAKPARTEAKPAAAAHASATPLIQPLTPFFGRDRELTQLRSLIARDDARLITLSGPGGVGKSRIAFALAREMQTLAPQTRICYAPFTDLSGEDQILPSLRRALGLPPDAEASLDGFAGCDTLCDALTPMRSGELPAPILLLIDGAEHLASALGMQLAYIAERVSHLTCLVTSRQRLLQPGEHEIVVGPLPIPPPSIFSTPDSPVNNVETLLANWPSIALFVERAQATLPDFALSRNNAEAVGSLVRRLEGIPLALELAAARIQSFTPSQILAQIDSRFDLLQSRRKRSTAEIDSPHGRRLSLRETIAWSFDLLSPDLRRVMQRLSVFRGGWTIAAATAIFAPNGLSDVDTIDRAAHPPTSLLAVADSLDQLCDASLLRAVANSDSEERRFVVLDTIREYADETLTPLARESARAAHALHFLRYAEAAEPHLMKEDAQVWLSRLAVEHDNLRATLDWSAETRSVEAANIGLRTATAMYRYWMVRGRLREGRVCIDRALLHPSVSTWDPKLEANARNRAGILAMTQGDVGTAEGLYRETLEIRRTLGDDLGIAGTLANQAILAAKQGRFDDAFARYEESLRYLARADDRRTMAVFLGNMGAMANDNNEPERATTYLTESIKINLELKNTRPAAISMLNLGEVNFKRGEWRRAERSFLDSLELFQPLLDVHGCAYALMGLGAVALERNQVRRAKRLIDTSYDAYATIGIPVSPFLESRIDILTAQDGQPARSHSRPKNLDSDAAIQALQALSLVVLDDWEDSGGDRREESEGEDSQPVRLRMVG